MVGGRVLEVCDDRQGRIYVNVGDRIYSRLQKCAIYVEKNANSDRIEIGDSLWWQGRYALWTPQDARRESDGGKCGIDYDIKIPRIGYSGVSHPFRDNTRENG